MQAVKAVCGPDGRALAEEWPQVDEVDLWPRFGQPSVACVQVANFRCELGRSRHDALQEHRSARARTFDLLENAAHGGGYVGAGDPQGKVVGSDEKHDGRGSIKCAWHPA